MKTKLLFILSVFTIFTVSAQFWTVQSTGFSTPSRAITKISIVDANVVWGMARDGSGNGDTIFEFSKTVDGGLNWVPGNISLGGTNLAIADLMAVSQDVAWVVANPAGNLPNGGIYKTIDGGVNWTRQNTALFSASGAFPNVVYFWDENNGVCQGDPTGGYFEIYTTTDGGSNWNRVSQANIPPHLTGEFGYVGQFFVTGDKAWFTTNKGRIYSSTDHGLNWSVSQSPISDFGSTSSSGEISFWNDNNGVLINQDGTFWNTLDGGSTWNISFPNSGIIFEGNIFCIPGTSVVVSTSASQTNPGSSYSLDGGQNWTVIDTNQHLDVQFLDATTGWSGGFNTDATTGGIFKYTGTELTAAVGSNELSITNAYPNPVKDIFTIEGVDIISNVSVFNMLGQEVLTTQPNVLTAKIDMSNLTSGSYVVKATVNGNTQTIKLIK